MCQIVSRVDDLLPERRWVGTEQLQSLGIERSQDGFDTPLQGMLISELDVTFETCLQSLVNSMGNRCQALTHRPFCKQKRRKGRELE